MAFHGGTLRGIDTYAEQIAAAGVTASTSVTLATVGSDNAKTLADRLGGLGVRVIADDPGRSLWRRRADRLEVQRAAADLFGTQTAARRLGAIWSGQPQIDAEA